MAFQMSVAVRNAQLDQFETVTGTAALLRFATGAQPVNCAAADAGTEVVQMTLPTDWMSAAASGVKSLLGTWQANAVAAGVIAHFRFKDSGDTTCHGQGSVTGTGGGGDMEADNTNVANGQQVTVTSFTITAGNA